MIAPAADAARVHIITEKPEDSPENNGMYLKQQLKTAAAATVASTPTDFLAGGIKMAINIP